MNKFQTIIDDNPQADDVQSVRRGLQQHNANSGHIDEAEELAIFLRDANNQIVGGIHADTWGSVCEINFLWVDESLRGQGHGRQLAGALEKPPLSAAARLPYWIPTPGKRPNSTPNSTNRSASARAMHGVAEIFYAERVDA